ncbi:hypothetical protein [Ruania albidiflava]|uniref:hypothetical protein n=1 Tax=Ruania albidiflava TaxID=366586 RepID=UPI0003B64A82|nr:hypothetical protein [Ruania albidiflava]
MKKITIIGAALLLLVGCAPAVEDAAAPTPTATASRSEASSPEKSTRQSETPGSDGSEAESPEAHTEPTEEATVDEYGVSEETDHGLLLKDVGQLAGLVSAYDEETVVQFTLTDIVLDLECTSEWPDQPENGHYVGLHFEVETFPRLADEPEPQLFMSSFDFVAWDDSGRRVNGPAPIGMCLDPSDEIPSPVGPAETLEGWVVLDVPTTSGTVGYVPNGIGYGGWEWRYDG